MELKSSVLVVAWLLGAGGTAWAQRSEAVSPGRTDEIVGIADICPSFSWSAAGDAIRYDLVVFALDEKGAAEGDVPPVLETSVPGSALSWTPSLDQCLEAGRAYAWFVRAIDPLGEGEWSPANLFTPVATPATLELEERLRLFRHSGHRVGASASTDRALASVRESNAVAPASDGPSSAKSATARPLAAKGLASGVAAIHAEVPDPTGETYGVRGISNSLAGAGIGAANAAGGVDLLLDGSSSGAADALLSESGIDRRSLTAQSFAFTNSQGGGMTLEIDGATVVTTSTDQDSLGALSCSTDEVARWNGSAWQCSAGAEVPAGAVMFFDLPSCPSGWSQFGSLAGRVPLGLPSGGTPSQTVGTALDAGGQRTISSVPAHSHAANPPSTLSTSAGNHLHTVNPVAVATSSTGAHSHTGTTSATNVLMDMSNGGYSTSYVQGAASNGAPALNETGPADSHLHTFTTDASGSHTHTVNIPTTGSSTAGSHTHSTDIPSFNTAATGVGAVDVTMPYIQLLACRKD